MDSRRGKPLTPEAKKLAVSVKHYFDQTPPYHPELQPIETCWGCEESYCEKLRFHDEEFDKTT